MFGTNFLAFGQTIDTGPRPFPAPPTPIQFPSWRAARQPQSFEPDQASDFFALYSTIGTRIDDVKDKHLESLNLITDEEVPVSALIPSEYLVPESWLDPNTTTENDMYQFAFPSPSLPNGRPCPTLMKFGENRVELLIDNAKAWPAITRAPLPKGQSHPRIRHFYKFWSCLDQMSVYWDTSLDNQPSPKDRKWNENVIGYKGRRVAAGTEMPERIREDAVKAFLQAACADFGLRVLDSSGPHRVCVRKAYFSARMTGQVLLPRLELDLARKGHHLGPLMGIHCNPNTIFRRVGEPEGRGHFERLARLQEIASILATAQERGREGKEEVVARDGAWWGKRPDWWPKGGDKWPIETFVPDPAEEPQRNEIENQSTEKQGEQAEGSTATLSEEGKISAANLDTELPPRKRYRDSNRAVMAMLAGTRCRPIRNPKDTPRWNPLMKYDRTGAEASDWDNIFIVEGVFHHVTIIKARVHRFFVNFLETGQLPDPATVVTSGEPHSDPWWVLRVQRTKWFDLLKADDRVELLRTVWSVSAYLVRDKSSEVGGARQDSVGEQTGALKI